MGDLFSRILQRLQLGVQCALTLGLVILISGMLPILVQGYAWIDMSRKSGGIGQLATVVTSAAPCEICHAAMELQEKSHSGDDAPVPIERIEILKSTSLADSSLLPIPQMQELAQHGWKRADDSRDPGSVDCAPDEPPPRSDVI